MRLVCGSVEERCSHNSQPGGPASRRHSARGLAGGAGTAEVRGPEPAGAMTGSGAPGPPGPGLASCSPRHRLLLLLLLLPGALAHKLKVPQVLLPFSRESGRVPFPLEAQRGCYTW